MWIQQDMNYMLGAMHPRLVVLLAEMCIKQKETFWKKMKEIEENYAQRAFEAKMVEAARTIANVWRTFKIKFKKALQSEDKLHNTVLEFSGAHHAITGGVEAQRAFLHSQTQLMRKLLVPEKLIPKMKKKTV